jgi:hypothetical protein
MVTAMPLTRFNKLAIAAYTILVLAVLVLLVCRISAGPA